MRSLPARGSGYIGETGIYSALCRVCGVTEIGGGVDGARGCGWGGFLQVSPSCALRPAVLSRIILRAFGRPERRTARAHSEWSVSPCAEWQVESVLWPFVMHASWSLPTSKTSLSP